MNNNDELITFGAAAEVYKLDPAQAYTLHRLLTGREVTALDSHENGRYYYLSDVARALKQLEVIAAADYLDSHADPTVPPDGYCTTREAQIALGITDPQLYYRIRAKRLDVVRLSDGRRWRVYVSKVSLEAEQQRASDDFETARPLWFL